MDLEKAIKTYNAAGNAAYGKLLKSMLDGKTKELLFVVVAMNRDEAQELLDEDAAIIDLLNQSELKRFQDFKTAFKDEFDSDAKTAHWLEHYQERREEWQPHLYPPTQEHSIVRLIEQESIKQYKRIKTANLPVKQHFWPNFVEAEDFFSQAAEAGDDEGDLIDAWSGLQARSVLVIDGFSLFHPRIRKVLELSPFLSKNDPFAALIFSPLREQIPLHPLEETLEATMKADMKLAFARFDRYFDPLYAFHLNSERRLKRWLFTSLGHLILLEHSAKLDNLERVLAQSRNGGVGRAIAGGAF